MLVSAFHRNGLCRDSVALMILTQKEKGRDRENDALHLLRLPKVDSASAKTMCKPIAEGARFLASRTKGSSILNVRWQTAF
jgi:hypothetical protein